MRRLTASLILLTAAFASRVSPAQTPPPGYSLVHITDNNVYHPWPRMNGKGQVVFAPWNSDWTTDEIYVYDMNTRVLTQITHDNVPDAFPDINDRGDIVWCRALGPPGPPGYAEAALEIVMLRDGVLTRLTDDAAADLAPRINDMGQVVWQRDSGVYACGGYLQDVWMFDGQHVVPVTQDADVDFVENQSPVINDSGQIAWTRYNFCNPPHGWLFTSDIMLRSNGQTIRVTRDDQPQAQGPSLNNRGQVVINYADAAVRRDAIAIWQNGVSTFICNSDCTAGTINDAGQLSFCGFNADGSTDIWLYKSGQFIRATNDGFRDIQPQISPSSDIVWSSGAGYPDEDLRLLRRLPNGDLNCDGSVNQLDVQGFVEALSNRAQYQQAHPNCDPFLADMNQDGTLNQFDIQGFVDTVSR